MLSTLQQDLWHPEQHLLLMYLELLRGILQILLLQVVHVIPRKRKKVFKQIATTIGENIQPGSRTALTGRRFHMQNLCLSQKNRV